MSLLKAPPWRRSPASKEKSPEVTTQRSVCATHSGHWTEHVGWPAAEYFRMNPAHWEKKKTRRNKLSGFGNRKGDRKLICSVNVLYIKYLKPKLMIISILYDICRLRWFIIYCCTHSPASTVWVKQQHQTWLENRKDQESPKSQLQQKYYGLVSSTVICLIFYLVSYNFIDTTIPQQPFSDLI